MLGYIRLDSKSKASKDQMRRQLPKGWRHCLLTARSSGRPDSEPERTAAKCHSIDLEPLPRLSFPSLLCSSSWRISSFVSLDCFLHLRRPATSSPQHGASTSRRLFRSPRRALQSPFPSPYCTHVNDACLLRGRGKESILLVESTTPPKRHLERILTC